MAISHILTLNYTRSGEALTANITLSGDSEENLSASWASAPTDLEFGYQLVVTDVVSLYMRYTGVADGDSLTVETNSGSAATSTITLKHNKPLVWYTGCGWALAGVLTGNITAGLFLTSSVATGSLEIRVLHDAAA